MGLVAAMLAPASAFAREESKIKVPLEQVNGSGDDRGMFRSHMSDDGTTPVATMSVGVQHLEPNFEYIVMGDGVEVARFTTNDEGNGGVGLDLLATGGGSTGSFDPRGKFVSVNDGAADILGAWVYADPAEDPRLAKVKEWTTLAPDATAAPAGRADARYDLLPNGRSRLWITLRGVATGDYDVAVDGVAVGSLSTNSAGNARLRFDERGGNGKSGPPHNKKGGLTFDPRHKTIDVSQAGVLMFSGPMLAQIGNLGSCVASSTVTAMTLDAAQTQGAGDVTTGNEDTCDVIFEVRVSALAAGDYDLVVDGAGVGTISVTDDGQGNLTGQLLFDENPDSGETALSFSFASGSVVEVKQGTTLFLSATLP
jgi:hypothetical protein